jgi:hypothetical protein
MGASSATPVEKLRDKDYQAKMDTPLLLWIMRVLITCTARRWCNKLSTRIGDYDKWAIKWGYSYFPEAAKEEKGILNEMTKEAYKTVAFGLELKLVHTIHVIKQRILEIML